MEKPPIGIMPKSTWESIRFSELKKAMDRYIEADLVVPIEWINEYNEFVNRIKS